MSAARKIGRVTQDSSEALGLTSAARTWAESISLASEYSASRASYRPPENPGASRLV